MPLDAFGLCWFYTLGLVLVMVTVTVQVKDLDVTDESLGVIMVSMDWSSLGIITSANAAGRSPSYPMYCIDCGSNVHAGLVLPEYSGNVP